jgi:hypothetical protein
MRQGQQNRRGRGRNNSSSNNNNNNNSNNGRKPQNPLARNYESSGPDVKIRGTAAQVAEKYMTLARDAASSGDPVLAENYLQHAEHYNRIIMAAQAQAAPMHQHQPNHGGDHIPGMNGQHRPQLDGQPVMREPQPALEQPSLLPPGMEPQPDIADAPSPADAVASPAPQTPGAAPGEQDGGRRRRRRYPSGGAARPEAGEAEQANGHNGSGNGLDASGDEHSTDEIVAN